MAAENAACPLPFEEAASSSFDTALDAVDRRKDYSEVRYVATGLLGGRVQVLRFTGAIEGIRLISFRKAGAREVKRFAKARASDEPIR